MTTQMTDAQSWMIYGVNGYTGRLCAVEAVKRGLQPIVAGRNKQRVAGLASTLGLPYRVFDLADVQAASAGLQEVGLVLNCAGPFSATARPMLEACVNARTHYLDVTGEISVFEYVHRNSARWAEAGIMALPGVGFDVVPTDCMAAMLKDALPDAVRLRLAFKSTHGKLSPGTTKTMLEGFTQGSAVRKDGQIVSIPTGSLSSTIPYSSGAALSVAIPWGDVSTAFYSTGIPNIEVYTAIPRGQMDQMKQMNNVARYLQRSWVQWLMKRVVEWKVQGPTEEERNRDVSQLYGDVVNEAGESVAMTMTAPNGYSLTFDSAITSVELVLAGNVFPGAQTPSMAFGKDFVLDLNGVTAAFLE